MIDSHCHLADPVFAADLEAVVERARGAGLERALVILEAANTAEATQAATLETIWPEVRFTVGVHPHHAQDYANEPARAAGAVRSQLTSTPSMRAIGEIGLDYHYDYSTPAVQRAVFRTQVELAREVRLPIVVHTREAAEDTIAILKGYGKKCAGRVPLLYRRHGPRRRGPGSGFLHLRVRYRHVPQVD